MLFHCGKVDYSTWFKAVFCIRITCKTVELHRCFGSNNGDFETIDLVWSLTFGDINSLGAGDVLLLLQCLFFIFLELL